MQRQASRDSLGEARGSFAFDVDVDVEGSDSSAR